MSVSSLGPSESLSLGRSVSAVLLLMLSADTAPFLRGEKRWIARRRLAN